MNGSSNGTSAALGLLAAPTRNNYFYGKLLDELHFRMEQTYLNRKRWLLNRLGLGSGVLCGLEVEVADDGECVLVRPGVALDAYGREIIVPESYCLRNPRQPTDACGRPDGDPIEGEGVVTLCLAYHECEAEPVPVLVGDCDTRQGCAPSVVRERYRLLVRVGEPDPPDPFPCEDLFPPDPDDDFDRRLAACGVLFGPCPAPTDGCVVLATITLPADEDDPVTVDACSYRRIVYSNARLVELLWCLAARVDACCRVRILRYVSGDAQQAAPGAQLPDPLIVEVVDGTGGAVADERVAFEVRGGGGTVSPVTVETDENGRAEARWRLGGASGLNTVEARLASGSHVVFHALAEGEGGEEGEPPEIDALEADPNPVPVGDTVTFQAQVSGDEPLAFAWDFGDGNESREERPTHRYGEAGLFQARLRVSNASGQAAGTVEVRVTEGEVEGEPPAIRAVLAEPDAGVIGQPVQFSAQVSGDRPLVFAWDFGDGNGSREESPTHRYASVGRFRVRLQVSNAAGRAGGETDVAITQGLVERTLNTIVFTQNESAFSTEARAALQQNVEILRQNEDLCVRIEGAALQNEPNAQPLAQRRADLVQRFYESQGVPRSRMTTSAVVRPRGTENRNVVSALMPCDQG